MPLPGRDLRISTPSLGTFTFDIVGAHEIGEEQLGPSGPIDFPMDDWFEGMQSIEQTLYYRQTPTIISSTGADTAFAHQIICQPMASTIPFAAGVSLPPAADIGLKQVDFLTNTYLAFANARYVYNLSGGQWQVARDMGAGITARDLAVAGGRIGIAESTAYDHSADGAAWANVALAADRWGVLNDKLYRAVRPNTLYATTGGFAGSWDSGSNIAESSYNINSVTGIEQILLIGKEDGIYSIDYDGYVVPFTPELRTQYNAKIASVQGVAAFNGDYYFRTLNGAILISGLDGQKKRVGLDQIVNPDLPTTVLGIAVKAFANDDRYLYALVENTSSGDLAILRRSVQGAWHMYYYETGPTKTAGHLAVSAALGYQALFFSYQTAGQPVVRAIRLSQYPNPLQDTNYRYDTSRAFRVRMPRIGTADAQIIIDRLDVQTRFAAAGISITPYAAFDDGAITQFGSAAITTNPRNTIIAATPVQGNYVDFYFDLVTNDSTKTPALLGFSYKGNWQNQRRRAHTWEVDLTKFHSTRRGGDTTRDFQSLLNDLEIIRASKLYATVTDEDGRTFQGLIQGTTVKRTLPSTTKGREMPESEGRTGTVVVWEKPNYAFFLALVSAAMFLANARVLT